MIAATLLAGTVLLAALALCLAFGDRQDPADDAKLAAELARKGGTR